MALDLAAFVDLLVTNVPELAPMVATHVADNDEVLLHVLTARVRERAVAEFEDGDRELAARIVATCAVGLADGDDQVENAVAVSFVGDLPWWDEGHSAFIATWPGGLRDEVERFRSWRP